MRRETGGQNAGLWSCCLTDTGHREALASPEDGRTGRRTARGRDASRETGRMGAWPEPLVGEGRRLCW